LHFPGFYLDAFVGFVLVCAAVLNQKLAVRS